MTKKPAFIERLAEKIGLIPDLHRTGDFENDIPRLTEPGDLTAFPPPEKWDDWVEYDAKAHPRKVEKHYSIVPTTCFNCESACGLLAYVDKETDQVKKFEGNPWHPGSRGRNCAKGPATINQITDPDRILYPMKRTGKRGDGQWERVSWDAALDDIAARIRKAFLEGRQNEVAYHVGRPGHEGYAERVLQSWGIDGHNSHTNICSSGARVGYALWYGHDRPSPDHANARCILLLSAHLESGHYFNPHAQRIIEGKMNGAKLLVMDPRLSNTASMADEWMPTYPGSEAAVLLAIALELLKNGWISRDYLEKWTNWAQFMEEGGGAKAATFDDFLEKLKETYAEFTPEFAEKESGVPAAQIRRVAKIVGEAGSRLSTHNWRGAGSGNLGGWCVARALHFLNVLTGSVGTVGGTSPNTWNKFVPKFFDQPPGQKFWNELHFPREYPLAFFEMSFLLPHFLKSGRGFMDVYFSRVFNPVWTYPDGFVWMEAFSDEKCFGLHVALTPTWSETAYFADYALPMGHASERHDLNSYETHSGVWIAFRQPVLREKMRRDGKPVEFTWQANPGEVWEEDEFWIELSWRIDPDGSLGIRKHFESPYRPGQKVTVDEYYQFIFEHVEGLPEAAAKEGMTALDYMKKYGAFVVKPSVYERNLRPLSEKELENTQTDPKTGAISRKGKPVGVMHEGRAVEGFPTPSGKNEFFSKTMVDWNWPEHAIPGYIKSHIAESEMDRAANEYPLVPTFRLPTLIHSRSGNAKWLYELSNRNPVWMHPIDARKIGVATGDLIRVETEIGHFIDRVWVTEGMKPGVVACSHHLGRWRRETDPAGNRWSTATVSIDSDGAGGWKMTQLAGIAPFESGDKDSRRVFWSDGGVHQNITFPVHPDPISGMHCWHQKVRLEKARPGDRYGDVFADTRKSMAVFEKWLAMARPASPETHGGLRRPFWMKRALRPDDSAYYF